MRTLKVVIIILLGLFILSGSYVMARLIRHRQNTPIKVTTITTPPPTLAPTPVPTSPPVQSTATASPVATPTPTLPPTINLDVPFTIQAPSQNWDAFHEETCEEAAILMAQWFAFGKSGVKEGNYANHIPINEAEKSLSDIVAWERNNVSDWKDTTTAETLRIAKEHLGMDQITLHEQPTLAFIKEQLSQGKILVAPTAGRLLKNPHFKQPGPPYHMIVLRGYGPKGFITNDPGIRDGEGYVYPEAVIMDAIHDWTGNVDTITNGKKVVLVVGTEP